MTLSQIIACTISGAAAAIAIWALVSLRRTTRQIRAERRTFPWRGGEITVTAPMSDADYQALKASFTGATTWPDGACEAYQPPATAVDSGLCARCGMYDYKHKEQPDA